MLSCVVACLLALAATETPVPEGVAYTERRETYPVYGSNRRELVASMRAAQARHRDEQGDQRSVARTSQTLGMRYELEPVAGGCRFKDLVVSLDVTIHLPEWSMQGAPKPLRESWKRMQAALVRHEEGHRDIAVESASYLSRGLRALGVQPDCQALRREAQRLFFRAQLRYSVRDGAYERRTNHGIAQGAVL